MTRQMVDSVLSVCEYNRFTKGIFTWVGYKTRWIEYENVERVAGETKWSFWKLFKYSLECIMAFSTVPLAISSFFGILFALIAVVGIVVVIVRQAVWGGSAYGWASTVCIILFVAGIQLFCIGILGQYLAKTYLETKRRPIYIAKETEKDIRRESADAIPSDERIYESIPLQMPSPAAAFRAYLHRSGRLRDGTGRRKRRLRSGRCKLRRRIGG